jgi:farnesyl-diphosphate farnesyltransferase
MFFPQHITAGKPPKKKMALRHVLKHVSRSFYLSLIVLPRQVREQVCLAYLFCRLADTIADAVCLSQAEKIQALQLFRKQFVVPTPTLDDLQQLQRLFWQKNIAKGEGELFFYLPYVFDFFKQLSCVDQRLLQELVLTLTRGMEMDLVYFAGNHVQVLRAFPDLATLDLYTYYVAGVVGEFWTNIHGVHLQSMQHCDIKHLCELGLRFGKALQLTNILKDLGRDLSNGRCYLPQDHLDQLGLDIEILKDTSSLQAVRPLVIQLVKCTILHLHYAREYLLSLPLRAIRLRLSCLWPLLFALQTLDETLQNAHLLLPEARVKISRMAVYRTMLFSLPCAISHRLCVRYYESLLQRLKTTLYTADLQQREAAILPPLQPLA